MKKGQRGKKKEWQKPACESLKFSQTLGGNKPQITESVTRGHGKHHGGSMTTIS